jgi:hypothetical protein
VATRVEFASEYLKKVGGNPSPVNGDSITIGAPKMSLGPNGIFYKGMANGR